MTLPNGIDGISAAIGTLFGSTGPVTAIAGAQTWGATGISQMNTLTQDNVHNLLKDNIIRTSPGWNSTSGALYQPGMTTGIPYSLSIIEQFVSTFTGIPIGSWDSTNAALAALEGIASNTDLQANWTTIFTDLDIPNASGLATYISNLSNDISQAGVGNWGALLSDLGLSGVPDLATFLNNSYTYGNTANSNFNALLTGLSQGDASALSTYIANAEANATAAANNWSTLLSATAQASSAAFASWVATAKADAANSVAWIDSVLSGLGLAGAVPFVNQILGISSTAAGANTAATTANNSISSLVDSIANGLGQAGPGHTISSIESYLGIIPSDNVLGIAGATSIGTAVQSAIDYLWQGFTGQTTTGKSFGQLANAASGTATTAGNAQDIAQSATMTQAQQTAAKEFSTAMGDTTVDATFKASATWTLSSMPTITLTQGASAIGYITTPDNVDKRAVMFVAETVGTVTGVYVNIFTVNTTTGLCTKVVTGSNIVSEIGNIEEVIYDNLASTLSVTPSEIFAVEVLMAGSGSLVMFGVTPNWAPTNSAMILGAPAGSRNTYKPVTLDAVGAGNSGIAGASPGVVTTSFTAAPGADVFVWAVGFAPGGYVIQALTITYGGVAMTVEMGDNLGSISGDGGLWCYRLAGAGTGTAKTVSATFTVASGAGVDMRILPVSYLNVGSVGTINATTGTSTAPSVGATNVTNGMVIGAAAGLNASTEPTLTGLNAAFTQRSLQQTGGANYPSLITGDSATTGAVTFSVTASQTSVWAAGTLVLNPGVPDPTAPATFTPTPSTSIPWLGLSAIGGTTVPIYAPVPYAFGPAGTYPLTLPSWFRLGVDYLDLVAVGGGGSGGAGIGQPGYNGTDSTVTIGGVVKLDATGGAGGPGGNTSQYGSIGGSPGNYDYLGQTYYGGGASAYNYGISAYGQTPGGGGAGGAYSGAYGQGGSPGSWASTTVQPTSSTISVVVGSGGPRSGIYGAEGGGDGEVWAIARQA